GRRRVRTDPHGVCASSARPRQTRSQPVHDRWLVRNREKRGLCVGPTKRGKGSKIMAVAERSGLPVAINVASASPHEVKLVKPTLDAGFLPEAPERLIGDNAYDSDTLAADLMSGDRLPTGVYLCRLEVGGQKL